MIVPPSVASVEAAQIHIDDHNAGFQRISTEVRTGKGPLMKGAIDRSDALIIGSSELNPEVLEYAKASGKPILEYQDSEDYYVAYNEFYDKIIGEE